MPFLPGFDESWTDAPDYIQGITREIWDERRIDRLARYYADDVVQRAPAALVQGTRDIIASAQVTLAEFPDLEVLGEDVIWCQTGYKSFLASQRTYCMGTQDGAGLYGAPTGQRVAYRILADRWCRGNEVAEEWVVRDQGAIVRQLGYEVEDWARALIAREGGPAACVAPFTPDRDVAARHSGAGNDNEWAHTLADLLGRMMAGDMSVVTRGYDRAVELAYPGRPTGAGRPEVERFWLGLRAAFPSARFEVDHAVGQDEPLSPPRAAVRWSLTGRHDGWGMFGAPSGGEVHVMGITHAEFGLRGLRREWTLIDEVSIWKQILLGSGRA